ncbi:MAG: thioredoxin domain-containing protein [Pirellulaceae bacterium]
MSRSRRRSMHRTHVTRPLPIHPLLGSLLIALAAAVATWGQDGKPAPRQAEREAEKAPQHTNRLAKETSLYLLMHAHNPVDWHPWGEEALAKAKKEKKLIFLSVGYSSCHWCHVMERESFLDKEIAALLNKHFVCIKVDREERPDIDQIYMTAVQIINNGRGGWPMSVFLTPDARPFFGGTYFPARDGDRGLATGFLTVLNKVQDLWETRPDDIDRSASQLAEYIKTQLDGRRPTALEMPKASSLAKATQQDLADTYDAKWGGFGYSELEPNRPKFPEASNLFFLLDRVERDKDDEEAKKMLVGTLEKMAWGGIRDHLGGGFHRYSVDRYWMIPHFEKMLYDNGQLATAYAEAYRLTGRDDFRTAAREICEFVLREMTDDAGGFYSALDAESEHEEGKFYRWEKAEIEKLLADDEYELFAAAYGLDEKPNFEEKYYAPQLSRSLAELAAERNEPAPLIEERLQVAREKLFAARAKRERPLTDTKVLTSWNGLMIRGLADTGRVLKEPRYVQAAEKAADFLLANLRTKEGRLLRTYSGGQAKLNAYLNDYAFLIDGLLALHRATGERRWLTAADALMQKQIELFWDEKNHGFYFTSDDHESLIARGKNPVDGAQPSGNSVSAENLLYLAEALDKPEHRTRVEQILRATSGLLERSAAAAPRLIVAAVKLGDRTDDAGASNDEKK